MQAAARQAVVQRIRLSGLTPENMRRLQSQVGVVQLNAVPAKDLADFAVCWLRQQYRQSPDAQAFNAGRALGVHV